MDVACAADGVTGAGERVAKGTVAVAARGRAVGQGYRVGAEAVQLSDDISDQAF